MKCKGSYNHIKINYEIYIKWAFHEDVQREIGVTHNDETIFHLQL